MFFLKKFMLCTGALFLIFLGGAGTQSTNALMQGGGIFVLIIGLIILYIFAKMAWRAMGCLPSLFAIMAIIVFILYAIGSFNGGIGNVIPNLKSFIGINSSAEASDSKQQSMVQGGIINLLQEEAEEPISENFSDEDFEEEAPKNEEKKGFLELLFGGSFSSKDKEQQPQEVYSVVYSSAGVISGDTLNIKGRKFRLFGIDAPEINQNCADSTGRAYSCGQQAISWLSGWLQDHPLQCRVMERDAKGNMIGTCSLGPYDIGAALVNAGWAVAYTKHSNVYLPYQEQAQKNVRGLWQGEFYMPWDWRKIQARKPKVKIIHKKSERKKTFGLFD